MVKTNNNEKIEYQKSLVNTKGKKLVSIIVGGYFPVTSLAVGNPVPNPVPMFQLSPEVLTLFSIISTCMTIAAGFIGVGFYVEKRNNNKLFTQAEMHRAEIKRMNDKIDEKTRDILEEIHELRKTLSDSVEYKAKVLEEKTALEVENARNLVDQKFVTIEEKLKHILEKIDYISHK